MNKTVIAIVAAVLLVGAGIGGYFLYTNNKPEKTSTVASSTPETNKDAEKAAKSVDVAAILDKVKTEYNTVTETKVFTEANDPNETLGKSGSYVSGGAFWDTRTEYSNEYDDDKERWGTDAGGSIEVYPSEAEAIKRGEYFGQFDQSSFLSPGAYKQVGNVVLRASSKYPKSVQDEVIAFLEKQVK